jgi:ERCC4-related helicase
VLVSGSGTNMDAIINACAEEKVNGQVIFVGSDTHEAKGLEKAAQKQIPTFVVDYAEIIKNFKNDPENHFFPDDFDFEEIKSMLYTLTSLTDLVFNYIKQYKEAGIIHKENEWSVKRITDTIKQFNKTNEYPDDTPEYVKTIQVSLKMNVSDAFVEEKKRTDVQKLIKTENKWGGTEWALKETTDPDYVKNYDDFGKDFNGN